MVLPEYAAMPTESLVGLRRLAESVERRVTQGRIRCPLAALIRACVRVATPSFLRAFSR